MCLVKVNYTYMTLSPGNGYILADVPELLVSLDLLV